MKLSEKDFRIGNYIHYHIEDEMDERKEYDVLEQIDYDDLRCLSTYEDNSEYRPIPLSEEWLMKFGAKIINHIHGYSFWSLHNTKLNNALIDIYEERTEFNSRRVNHCKYVHQLQNLYFALTGEELILKT